MAPLLPVPSFSGGHATFQIRASFPRQLPSGSPSLSPGFFRQTISLSDSCPLFPPSSRHNLACGFSPPVLSHLGEILELLDHR